MKVRGRVKVNLIYKKDGAVNDRIVVNLVDFDAQRIFHYIRDTIKQSLVGNFLDFYELGDFVIILTDNGQCDNEIITGVTARYIYDILKNLGLKVST